MKLWAVEVKPGEKREVKFEGRRYLRLRQAALVECDWKAQGSVSLLVNGKKKATLEIGKQPVQLFGWVFAQEFTLSHTWKDGSVLFYGATYMELKEIFPQDEKQD